MGVLKGFKCYISPPVRSNDANTSMDSQEDEDQVDDFIKALLHPDKDDSNGNED